MTSLSPSAKRGILPLYPMALIARRRLSPGISAWASNPVDLNPATSADGWENNRVRPSE
jgi:hypothetical protein